MMDKILDIVPYKGEHGIFIMNQKMNHELMDRDMKFKGNMNNLEQQNLAFTGLIKNKPIFAAGMKMIWDGVAEGWVIATDDVWQHPLLVARAIKKDFERIARQHNIKRVQTSVRQDFKHGIKFAEWLGLENEGLMKYFGFDGSHQYRYARIF